MKKYEFTDETKKYRGTTLHRIRAIRDFGNIKKRRFRGIYRKGGQLIS